jgi:predicted SprT family Zn-dependent metalloprotease
MARKSMKMSTAITPVEYSGLQAAYEYFNEALFDGALPDVFITYQRRANSLGYFSADRFNGRLDKTGRHELALNPDGFIGHTDKQITSTLVHEQAHVWQHANGTAPKRGYHDRQWAVKMKEIGLQPSSTGMPGGRETGQRMSHYLIPGGAFEQVYDKLAASGWKLNLESAHRPGQQKGPSSKTKFTCSECGQNVWGKPDTSVDCHECKVRMREAA